MKKTRRGRRIAIRAGCALAILFVLILRNTDEIRKWYLSWHWRQIAVVVLDNCDPDFKGQGPHGDAVRFLSSDGDEQWVLSGLNNAESVGAHHRVVVDPDRFRIYFCEDVKRRVSCIDLSGKLVFERENMQIRAMSVDPETGNLWCLVGSSFGTGETIVLDRKGNRVATHPINGIDIAYSPYDQAFWTVGYPITKFDCDGRILFQLPRIAWGRVSVAPDPRDGGAWIVERDHPDVPGSVNKLLYLDGKGSLVQEIDLGTRDPFAVAYEPESRTVWVADHGKALLRVSAVGDVLPPLAIPAKSIAVSRTTGAV